MVIMAVADQRITIRDKSTGELRHGIKGHIPNGYEAVQSKHEEGAKKTPDKVEDHQSRPSGGTQKESDVYKPPLQTVRGKESDTVRKSAGKPGTPKPR
jgi:hypothetical protein